MDIEQKAIKRLKMASDISLQHYGKPLIVMISGGKDSDISLELTVRSGIPFEVMHSHTTADAPHTVYHVRKQLRELELRGIKCTANKPMFHGVRTSMWDLISKKTMPPTQIKRYCCEVLKESCGLGRMITTGVRWDESNQRSSRGELEVIGNKKKDRISLLPDNGQLTLFKNNDNDPKRRFIERCELQAKTVCNPIIDWTTTDVWQFIRSEKLEVNPLYQCGFHRVGCIGCPMASLKEKQQQFLMFPTYKRAYIRAFDKMLSAIKQNADKQVTWKTGQEVFDWWIRVEENPDQMMMGFE